MSSWSNYHKERERLEGAATDHCQCDQNLSGDGRSHRDPKTAIRACISLFEAGKWQKGVGWSEASPGFLEIDGIRIERTGWAGYGGEWSQFEGCLIWVDLWLHAPNMGVAT